MDQVIFRSTGVQCDREHDLKDNKSAILLENNGKKSSSQRTRHLNIKYFFVTDQVEQGNAVIKFCPTDGMTADFMSKPLQGEKFRSFRKDIMNL